MACGILVPQRGTEPVPLAVKHGVLTTGPPGNSLNFGFEQSSWYIAGKDWAL